MTLSSLCPICQTPSKAFDCVDFNKNYEERRGVFLPLSGKAVYYHRCPNCGFVFAPEFQTWNDSDFETRIYNQEYQKIDPDYVQLRPTAWANELIRAFWTQKNSIRHLDYGAGTGKLSVLMQKAALTPLPTINIRVVHRTRIPWDSLI